MPTQTPTLTPPVGSNQISIGATESGVITAGETDRWTFEGTAGQVVIINLYASSGSNLDPYMILNDPSGAEATYDDDGGPAINSRIQRTLGSTGTYMILARGYDGRPGSFTGAYELSLESGSAATPTPAPTPVPTPTPTPVASQGEIAFGGTESGNITSGETEVWTFEGTAGQTVTINLYASSGSSLDTYLILNDPSGAEEANNDDGGTRLNSRIQHTLGSTGTYMILARGFNGRPGSSTGAYELSLESGSVAAPTPTPAPTASQGEIAIGGTESGVITAGETEVWTFEGTAGQTVTINLYASPGSSLDTYLILNDPRGVEEAYDDDGGTGLNSRIQHTLSSIGTYSILARGFSGSAAGAYELSLER